jgi:hypothetical protein
MSEDWCEITKEKVEARLSYISNVFSQWKKRFCENMNTCTNDPRFLTLASTEFAREHRKFLMTEIDGSFPTFLIAQLWFALEPWGLTAIAKVDNNK